MSFYEHSHREVNFFLGEMDDRKNYIFSEDKGILTHFINHTQLVSLICKYLSVLKIALITLRIGPFDSGNELLEKIFVFYHVFCSTT